MCRRSRSRAEPTEAGSKHAPCRSGEAATAGLAAQNGLPPGSVHARRRSGPDVRPSSSTPCPSEQALCPPVFAPRAHGVPVRADNHGRQRCEPTRTTSQAQAVCARRRCTARPSAVASRAESAGSILVTRSCRSPRSATWGFCVTGRSASAHACQEYEGRARGGTRSPSVRRFHRSRRRRTPPACGLATLAAAPTRGGLGSPFPVNLTRAGDTPRRPRTPGSGILEGTWAPGASVTSGGRVPCASARPHTRLGGRQSTEAMKSSILRFTSSAWSIWGPCPVPVTISARAPGIRRGTRSLCRSGCTRRLRLPSTR
ncbi:hypothetical protein SUDANB15_03878 [Streptomyces sp. enrichment culture]